MKCEICHKTSDLDKVAVYRVSPIGDFPTVWRCGAHLSPEQRARLDPTILHMIKVLEGENPIHNELCDIHDVNPDGIRKPCNCGRSHL